MGDPAFVNLRPMMFQLIDSATREQLSIRSSTAVPRNQMPAVGAFTDSDQTCVLNWINSAIMLNKVPGTHA